MKFDVTAVVKEIGAIETVGASGFQKRNLILTEQNGDYENLVCIEFSGDKLTSPDFCQVGQTVTVSGFVNCRQWQDKYFTSLKGSYIEVSQPAQQTQQQTQAPQQYAPPQNQVPQPQQYTPPAQQQYQQAPPVPQQQPQQPQQQQYSQPVQQPTQQQGDIPF